MAYDSWENFNDVEKIRVARRFRHHVRTKRNPRGRIRREPCQVDGCGEEKSEAHHIDYSKPFVVVWLCFTHHRHVERKKLRIKKRWIWDYSSLLWVRQDKWLDTPF